MRLLAALLLLLSVALSGCTTKAQARADRRRAFLAGQQLAAERMQQQHPSPESAPTVTFVGPVQVPVLIWSPDLTLAHAIVEAEYAGAADPRLIIVHRNGQEIRVTPQRLLDGEDVLLEAGDIVQIQP